MSDLVLFNFARYYATGYPYPALGQHLDFSFLGIPRVILTELLHSNALTSSNLLTCGQFTEILMVQFNEPDQ